MATTVLRRMFPGAFPATPNGHQDMDAVRAAAIDLYQAMGMPIVIPALDQPGTPSSPMWEAFEKNPLLFMAGWYVSFRMSAIPIKVFNWPSKEENIDHPAYQLFRRPNPDLTRPLLMGGTILSMFVFNKAGWFKERQKPRGPKDKSNPPVALWPIPGPYFVPLRSAKRLIAGYELRVPGNPPVELDPRDVVYHRMMPGIADWSDGLSPYKSLAGLDGLSMDAIRRLGRLYRSAMAQRVWIDMHGADLEDEARERLRTEMEVAMSSDGRSPIMEGGATLEALGATTNEEMLTSGLTLAEKLIQKTLGLPEDDKDDKAFYTKIVQPIADGMENEWERSLMPDFSPEAYPQFMFRNILQGSPEEQARYWQIEILSAQATPNEARSAQDREPEDGGDQLFVPLNVVPVSLAGAAQQAKADSAGGLGGAEGRGVQPRVPQGREGETEATNGQRAPMRAAGQPLPLLMRAGGVRNWELVRNRLIEAQGRGLGRRFRGTVGKEGDRLRELIAPVDRMPAKGTRYEKLDPSLVSTEMDTTDLEVRTVMQGAMRRTAQEAYRLAVQLIEGIDAIPNYPEVVDAQVTQRIEGIVEAFRDRRLELLDEVEGRGGDAADIFRAIGEEWNKLGNHLTDIIGPTETAWAFERAASAGWDARGFVEFAVQVRTSGCRTGMCTDAANSTYPASAVPTPLHPGCKCVVVPIELAG